MSAVSIESLSVQYGGSGAPAVCEANLKMEPGELHVLLGQSGSGKTTLLRAIAGFERASSGQIRLGATVVDGGRGGPWLPPERRGVGVVFQDYALFPHLNVLKNVAFSGAEHSRCRQLLELVGLVGYEGRAISELSGGEQQRVALARALAQEPKLILLDEPFSNLDPNLRHELRAETVRVLRASDATGLFVTHDREEAFALADRLSVIHESRLLQSGTPQELYDSPCASQVATALGDVCLLSASPRGDGGVETILGVVRTRGEGKHAVVRPEQIEIREDGVAANVISCHYAGGSWSITASVANTTVRLQHDERVSGELRLGIRGTIALVPS